MPVSDSRRGLRLAGLAAAGLMLAGAAQADYLWLQPAGQAVELRAGELLKPQAALPALQSPAAKQSDGRDVALVPGPGRFVLADAAGDLRFTAVQRGAPGVLVYHQARWGRAGTQAANDLELVPTEPDGSSFRLMWKGKPVAASQVDVQTSEGWTRTLRPAADGSVSLRTAFPGLYVLEVSARVNGGSVTLDGVKYDDVRHTATLSFEVRP